jgi:hypothetical protein
MSDLLYFRRHESLTFDHPHSPCLTLPHPAREVRGLKRHGVGEFDGMVFRPLLELHPASFHFDVLDSS